MFVARESLLREPVLSAPSPALSSSSDPISSWFRAAEEMGEYIGIRFGQIAPGKDAPDWTFLRHSEFDGIGGFADILRGRGAQLSRLPQIKHPSLPTPWPLLRTWANYLEPRRRVELRPVIGRPAESSAAQPPSAVAWHVFDEESTTRIRRVCRKQSITVNSFLLKHLTKAVRPSLVDESSVVPWMIPVNMRGKVVRDRDTANYSSYVGVQVKSYETAHDIHRNIYAALARAEHWANWYAYGSGRFLAMPLKKYLIKTEKCTSQWNLGGFSNLGDWDAEKQISQAGCVGPWLFCPPVLRCQVIGAGAVTFQNRLSLTMQVHPELTTSSDAVWHWVQHWVKEIDMDLSSMLPES